MRVRFTDTVVYENEGRNTGHTFKEGEVYDFEESFATRWTRRGLAEVVPGGETSATVGTSGPFVAIEAPEAQAAAEQAAAEKAAAEQAAAEQAAAEPPKADKPVVSTRTRG